MKVMKRVTILWFTLMPIYITVTMDIDPAQNKRPLPNPDITQSTKKIHIVNQAAVTQSSKALIALKQLSTSQSPEAMQAYLCFANRVKHHQPIIYENSKLLLASLVLTDQEGNPLEAAREAFRELGNSTTFTPQELLKQSSSV